MSSTEQQPLPPHAWDCAFVDASGRPLAGALVFIWEVIPDPDTKAEARSVARVFRDPGLTILHANPLELSSSGEELIYFKPGTYRVDVRANRSSNSRIWSGKLTVSEASVATKTELRKARRAIATAW